MDAKLKARILKTINDPLPFDMDELECKEWMSLIAEAKRYVLKKIVVCEKRINEIDLLLERLEAKIADNIYTSKEGTATERKGLVNTRLIRTKGYNELWKEVYDLREQIGYYQADLENLNEKAWSVRKFADFERIHMQYEEE